MEYRINIENDNLFSKNISLDIDKCDGYDYLIAGSCGIVAGLIDSFFVGMPIPSGKNKFLVEITDSSIIEIIIRFAKTMGWNPREGNEESLSGAISFLERKFKVNYDQAKSMDVNGSLNLLPNNHHIKSLAHSPDIIGLFFSIIDQFTGKSHFIDNGKIISIDVEKQELKGENFIAKLFSGFVNWIGHLMSDVAGSSGSIRRGSGLNIPFMNLFGLCGVGEFTYENEKMNIAKMAVQIFQRGYDFRFGMAMAIPVFLNDLFIKLIWSLKRKFYKNINWSECIPTDSHKDLRTMLLIGTGALCIFDSIDALVRGGGNIILVILRMNIIAWARLVMLIFKELKIRYGQIALQAMKNFINEMKDFIVIEFYKVFSGVREIFDARAEIEAFYERMRKLNDELNQDYIIFINKINKEYELIKKELRILGDVIIDIDIRIESSIKLAEYKGVEEDKIIKNNEDLDDFFLN